MNSWVKSYISEGSLGAKLGDGLLSPGPGMAGGNQWAVREHSGVYFYLLFLLYFYLLFLLNGASAWLCLGLAHPPPGILCCHLHKWEGTVSN